MLIHVVYLYVCIICRFVFLTPPVKSPGLYLHSTANSSSLSYDQLIAHVSHHHLQDTAEMLHPIQTRMLVQFPEKRLIQYDCGKTIAVEQ